MPGQTDVNSRKTGGTRSGISIPTGAVDHGTNSSYGASTSISTSPTSMSSLNSGLTGSYSPITMSPSQYLSRLVDVYQMDMQSVLDQMYSLLSFSPTETQKVYKLAYYRKQTKNHWARDDPAFVSVQIALLFASSLAYCIAFRTDGILSNTLSFAFQSIVVNFLLAGGILATTGRAVANQHLTVTSSASHVRQSVEWMYAFDIHCNAFFPLFVMLYGVQFFLLPFVLKANFVAFLMSNMLYGVAFSWYFYVTHLGYRALPFLRNTEVFLFPIAGVAFIFAANLAGYPVGFGWNASRIFAHLYFEME